MISGDCLRQRRTKEKNWSEDSIELNYEATFFVIDMSDLKNYFSDGIILKLVENRVVVSPDPPPLPEDFVSVMGDGDLGEFSLKVHQPPSVGIEATL